MRTILGAGVPQWSLITGVTGGVSVADWRKMMPDMRAERRLSQAMLGRLYLFRHETLRGDFWARLHSTGAVDPGIDIGSNHTVF
jgi:hypothetical protein